MISGKLVARVKNYVIKSYNYQVEWIKTFKKDWKEMEDASAPIPNPPEWEPKLMTIANARKLPWSTLKLILSDTITMYKMTLTDKEKAIKMIEEEEALLESKRLFRLKKRLRENSNDPSVDIETFEFNKNLPKEISEMIEKLKTTDPKLYEEALKIKDVKGAFAFMREHQGSSSDQFKAVATNRMELMGDCIREFMTSYKEGKEKAYKESSVDDKYFENITSPFYAVMSAKVDEVVDGDKKVDKNDEKNDPKIPKSSFYEEFSKLSEKFTKNDDTDNSLKSKDNTTNTSSSSLPFKRRQSSVNNRINDENKSSGIVGDYIDNFLESRNENLSPIELANRKKILEERIFKRDKNLLEAFDTADKAKEYVDNYTNSDNNNGVENDNTNKKTNLNRINENNSDKFVEGESKIKKKLEEFLSKSSRNEILNHFNDSNSSINTKNDNVMKNLNRGTSVLLALEEELTKFKKDHFDTYNPEKDSNEEIIKKKNETSANFRNNKKYQNNRILSTSEKNELYEKELLQNKKITNELKNKGEEMVFSYSDYLISKSKSLLPFNFSTEKVAIKNRKKDLRSNNRK